jgi:phosphoribosyl-ATP pyrophosphohydrolase
MQKLKKPEEGGIGRGRKPRSPAGVFASEKDRAERILFELELVVKRKRELPVDPASYTSRIVRDRPKLGKKLVEEAFEVATAPKKANVVWEAADMLYFAVTYLVNRGVPLMDVLGELTRRRDQEKPGQRYAPTKASVPD